MSPVAIFADILRTYRRWAPQLILLALVVFVPVSLIHAVPVHAEVTSLTYEGWLHIFAILIAVVVLAITGLLGEVFYTGVVTLGLTHTGEGLPGLRQMARELNYGRLIAIDVLYGLLVAIGLALLIAPGVAAFVLLALAAPVAEREDRDVWAAFRRSMALIRGRFWVVFAVLAPIQLASQGVDHLANEVAVHLIGNTLVATWLAEVVSSVAVSPFFAIAAVLLMVRLAAEKEGAPVPAVSRESP